LRPIITEKGLRVKERHTVVFEFRWRNEDARSREAVQQIFKVKVAAVRTANFLQDARRAKTKLPADWKGLREARRRREDEEYGEL